MSDDQSPIPTPSQREVLVRRWLSVAALEHASVGSFARFPLQLLAVGAPPDLLLATQQAAADEVRHAVFAYGQASRFAGEALGPGPLPLDEAMPALDVRGVIAGLLDEACIGESVGAAEAAVCADAARDSAIRTGLSQVAKDEASHAALAWKSLRWLLMQHPGELDFASSHFDAALSQHRARLSAVGDDDDLSTWGFPSGQARCAAQLEALDSVVVEVGRALFASLRSSH